MSSEAKYRLSDGTPATIGRIVVVIDGKCNGNPAGTITKILGNFQDDGGGMGCECLWKSYPKIRLWEKLYDLRKATPDEKAEWRAWLKNQPMWRAVS